MNGFQIRIDHDNSQDRILVVSTVQFEAGPAEVLPVHENLLAALRILRRRMTPSHQFLGAGR